MKADDEMALKNMIKLDTREDAITILEKFQSQRFLAEIDTIPELSADGRITNLDLFIQYKNKPSFRSGSSNPVHQIYTTAPKVVSVILEAIDDMDATPAEKQILFEVFISETKEADEVDEGTLNQALDAFMSVYKGHELEGPKGCR